MKEKSIPSHAFKKNKDESIWWQPAIIMFARLSAWIVAPVLLATIFGNWLDKRLDSAPFGLIGIVGISFIISMMGLIIETTKEYKKIEKKNSKSQIINNK